MPAAQQTIHGVLTATVPAPGEVSEPAAEEWRSSLVDGPLVAATAASIGDRDASEARGNGERTTAIVRTLRTLGVCVRRRGRGGRRDRKSTRLNSSHLVITYA